MCPGYDIAAIARRRPLGHDDDACNLIAFASDCARLVSDAEGVSA